MAFLCLFIKLSAFPKKSNDSLDKAPFICYYTKVVDAGVAELADARDLKSREIKISYRFEPGFRHQHIYYIPRSRAVR